MHKNPSVWVCTLIWVVESEDMVFTNDDPGPCFQFCFLRYLFTIYIHNSTFNGQQSHFSCKITITLCNFLSTWKKKNLQKLPKMIYVHEYYTSIAIKVSRRFKILRLLSKVLRITVVIRKCRVKCSIIQLIM